MKFRECDDWGCGHFGAPRGDRTHNGIDIECHPGERVYCLNPGLVTKIGYPYADDLSYRYVEIVNGKYRWRYFYVEPIVGVGDELDAYTIIGEAQSLASRYPGITPHVHLEIIDPDGEYVDPKPFVSE